MNAALKAAIKLIKTVKCWRCDKGFKTDLGLVLHWLKCGKTAEEVEASKVTCEHCPFRTMRYAMYSHKISQHPEVYGKSSTEDVAGVKPSADPLSGMVIKKLISC